MTTLTTEIGRTNQLVETQRIVYTPERLMELEEHAVLPPNCVLPDREFYRFHHPPTESLKIANYLRNLKNPNFRAKHKLGTLSNSKDSKTRSHYHQHDTYDDTESPAWLQETDFKVDNSFDKYMISGDHTTEDFEREKLLFHSAHGARGKKQFATVPQSGDKKVDDDKESLDDSEATYYTRNDEIADNDTQTINKNNIELERELQKQFQNPEILGPTEEEYFQSLEREKEEQRRKKEDIQTKDSQSKKSSAADSDFQFAMELVTRKEIDNSFFNSLLEKSGSNMSKTDLPKESTPASEKSSISGPVTLPSVNNSGSRLDANRISTPDSNLGIIPPGISQEQSQQMNQLKMNQMNQMNQMHQIQQMQQMQQPQQSLQNQQLNFSTQNRVSSSGQISNQENHINNNSLKNPVNMANNLPPGMLPNFSSPHQNLPPHILQQLKQRQSNENFAAGSPGLLQQQQNQQQQHYQQQHILPMHNRMMPPGLQNIQGMPVQPGMNIRGAHMNPNINPKMMVPPGINHPGPPGSLGMSMPPGMLPPPGMIPPPGIIPPRGMMMQPPGQMQPRFPSNLPPPDKLPSPYKEKFMDIQRLLLHFQQNGQTPPPPLVQEMMAFHRMLEAKFSENQAST